MPLQLSPEHAIFLEGPLSMNVGAVGHDGWPCVARGQGLIVARDRRLLTVLLSASHGRAVLDAVEAGSAITLVASRAATHATLQVKARGASWARATTAQKAASTRCLAAFGGELSDLGYGIGLDRVLPALFPTDDLVALSLAPEVVFDQTPGPQAGTVLARA